MSPVPSMTFLPFLLNMYIVSYICIIQWSYIWGMFMIKRWIPTSLSYAFLLLLFSRSIVSNSFWPQGLQHARLPCPSPSRRACSNSCPLSWWCHSTISSSVVPFSSCLQSFPASGSFLISQLFASGGQSIRASASASVLPVNFQDWFPLGLTGFDLLTVQKTLKSFIQHRSSKASILWQSAFFIAQLSHP